MKKKIIDEITGELDHLQRTIPSPELSDIGNAIGYVIAKYFDKDSLGNKTDFISGLNHGISLVDGTHG